MRRKTIYYMGLLIFILVFLTNCNSKSSEDHEENADITKLQADIAKLPNILSRDSIKIIIMSGQQQYRYQSIVGEERLILEIRTQTSDTETVTEADTSVLYKPEVGESIFEWTQDNLECRLFGTFSEAELQEISESVQVKSHG